MYKSVRNACDIGASISSVRSGAIIIPASITFYKFEANVAQTSFYTK